jgi:hypothetical protein
MNPEVHKIIEAMQELAPARRVDLSDYQKVQTHQALNMARLMVLLAEEQEKASAKMEQLTTRLIAQTDTLIKFTKGLYWFTAALLALGVVQLFAAFTCHR